MKKRVLSLFMVLVLCLTLLPTAAFAEGEDVSISGGVIGGGETGGEDGGIYVAPGSPTEGGGGTYIPGEDTRTEIWCVSKPDSIGRSYDGTTDGGTIPIDLTFTDGTNEIKLKEGTGFTAKKTFDSADAGRHTVTVEIALIGEAAARLVPAPGAMSLLALVGVVATRRRLAPRITPAHPHQRPTGVRLRQGRDLSRRSEPAV